MERDESMLSSKPNDLAIEKEMVIRLSPFFVSTGVIVVACWSAMLLVDPEPPHAEIALLHVQADRVVPFACRGDVSAVCCELPADTRTLLVSGTFRAASPGPTAEPGQAAIVVSSVCTVE